MGHKVFYVVCSGIKLYTRKLNFFFPDCTICYYIWKVNWISPRKVLDYWTEQIYVYALSLIIYSKSLFHFRNRNCQCSCMSFPWNWRRLIIQSVSYCFSVNVTVIQNPITTKFLIKTKILKYVIIEIKELKNLSF